MRKEIYKVIDEKRQYQDNKHGGHYHSVGEWMLIIEHELGKAKNKWALGSAEEALKRFIDIAAVTVAGLEQHCNKPIYTRASLPEVADGVEVDCTGLPMNPFDSKSWK